MRYKVAQKTPLNGGISYRRVKRVSSKRTERHTIALISITLEVTSLNPLLEFLQVEHLEEIPAHLSPKPTFSTLLISSPIQDDQSRVGGSCFDVANQIGKFLVYPSRLGLPSAEDRQTAGIFIRVKENKITANRGLKDPLTQHESPGKDGNFLFRKKVVGWNQLKSGFNKD